MFSKFLSRDKIALLLYLVTFFYLISQSAIYSPDTSSYLKASIWRSPGYSTFSVIFKFIFKDYFDIVTVGFQLIFGLFSVHFFARQLTKIIKINTIVFFGILLVLVFPFYYPLYVANNICSEGLSYPLYLLFLGFSIDFLFLDKTKSFSFLIVCCILLALTRGQFLICALVVAVIYALKYKRTLFKQKHLIIVMLLILSIPITSAIDKTFHKLTRDQFVSTPFTYVNACAGALYVSNMDNLKDISNPDDKAIFKICLEKMSKNNWLMSYKENATLEEKYEYFHDNLVNICNLTLHNKGRDYYISKGYEKTEALIKVENTSKRLYFTLVKNNFKNYSLLFLSNLTHAFKSIFVMIFIVFCVIFSGTKLIKSYNINYALMLFFSTLTLGNAMVVAFASHSIMRYLFYNYNLIIILIVLLYQILKRKYAS